MFCYRRDNERTVGFSLRLGHARVLTTHCVVIHYAHAASLRRSLRFGVGYHHARPAPSFSSVAKNLVGRFHSRMTTRRMRSKESGVACSRMTTRGEHGDNQYQACRAGACSRRKTKEWQNRLTYEVRLCLERTVGDASPYKHNYNPHQSVGVGAHDDPRPLAFSSGRRCRGIAVTDEVFISTNQLLIHRQRRSPFSRRRRLFVSWLLSPPRSFA